MGELIKRFFVGRPLATTQMEHQRLSKTIALPVFSSDALSSTAYATEEILFVTAVGDDDLGRQALDLYRREGIDVSHARVVEGMSSGVALIFVDDRGLIFLVDRVRGFHILERI